MIKLNLSSIILAIGLMTYSAIIFATPGTQNVQNSQKSTFTRLYLSINSTQEHPQYFQCSIAPDTNNPTGIDVPLRFTQVRMVNYAQMISNFNGLGILDTTAEYVNSYTFSAYHDPSKFAVNKKGFVDIFVAWPSYFVTCKTVTAPTKDRPLPASFG